MYKDIKAKLQSRKYKVRKYKLYIAAHRLLIKLKEGRQTSKGTIIKPVKSILNGYGHFVS